MYDSILLLLIFLMGRFIETGVDMTRPKFDSRVILPYEIPQQ